MSQHDIQAYRRKINQIGPWAGVRMLRNKGITFNQAYFIMFGKHPRLIVGHE